jgi:hypothetical protein
MNHTLRCAIVLVTAALCRAQQTSTAANAIILAGAGYHVPSPSLDVAPGQVIVLHVHGVATNIDSNLVAVPAQSGFTSYSSFLRRHSAEASAVWNPSAKNLGCRQCYITAPGLVRCLQPDAGGMRPAANRSRNTQ